MPPRSNSAKIDEIADNLEALTRMVLSRLDRIEAGIAAAPTQFMSLPPDGNANLTVLRGGISIHALCDECGAAEPVHFDHCSSYKPPAA